MRDKKKIIRTETSYNGPASFIVVVEEWGFVNLNERMFLIGNENVERLTNSLDESGEEIAIEHLFFLLSHMRIHTQRDF